MHALIVLATSVEDFLGWCAEQPVVPRNVLMLTPRTAARARGVVAEGVLATPAAREHPDFDRMLQVSLPTTMARDCPQLAWERS